MIVYVDIVIVENLVINFFLLLVTMQIMSIKVKYRRIFLSSSIGAIYTLSLFFSQTSFLTTFLGKLLFALLMIYIILKDKGIVTTIKGLLIFYLVSFTFCGILFMFALTQNGYDITKAFTLQSYSIKYLLFGGMVIYITMSRIIFYVKDRMVISNLIYDLEININDEVTKIKGFLDTGNELVEPVTTLPVIIVEKTNFLNVNINKEEQFSIPYKVVNGDKGSIKGVKAKEVKLVKKDGQVLSKEAIICFCEGTLSASGDYNALLSRGII